MPDPHSRGGGRPEVNRALLRRQACLDSVGDELLRRMQRRDNASDAFICAADVAAIWVADETRLDAILWDNELSVTQRAVVRTRLLSFLSYLVWIEVSSNWFSAFRQRVFHPADSASLAASLEGGMPFSRDVLEWLGIAHNKVEKSWEDQYRFLPATLYFKGDESIQDIPDRHVRMPFLEKEDRVVHGGYGNVQFYKIAPSYVVIESGGHRWSSSEPYAVAIKTFRRGEDATVEVENLRVLKESLTENKHVALHHAIIKHHVDYHIIFPRAQLGDLQQFLHGGFSVGPRNERTEDYSFQAMFPGAGRYEGYLFASPLLEQCKAIAEAIAFLHKGFSTAASRVFCAHMDLKPNNILIFYEPHLVVGKWKICDFGISVFKEDIESALSSEVVSVRDLYEQMTFNTKARRDVSTYQAPEVDQAALSPASGSADRRVGRQSDVWSFGAIFSEILAFALKREGHVEEFQRNRTERNRSNGTKNDRFYSPANGLNLAPEASGFQVRPAVLDWLEDQAKDFGADRGSVPCWVKCIKKILKISPKDRPPANELGELVRHLVDHVHKEQQGVQMNLIPCPLLAAATSPPLDRILEGRETRASSGSEGDQHPMPQITFRAPTIPLQPQADPNSPLMSSQQWQYQRDDLARPSMGPPAHSINPLSTSAASTRPVEELIDLWSVSSRHSLGCVGYGDTTGPISSGSGSVPASRNESSRRRNRESVSTSQLGHSVPGEDSTPGGLLGSSSTTRRLATPSIRQPTFPGLSGTKIIALDNERIVYLVKGGNGTYSVHVFGIQPERPDAELITYETGVTLSQSKKFSWTGIAISRRILVCWGKCGLSKKSKLNVFRLGTRLLDRTPPETINMPYDIKLDDFDHLKSVTVSAQGIITVIRGSDLLSIDTNSYYAGVVCRTVRRPAAVVDHRRHRHTQSEEPQCIDIVYDDTGVQLYAWAKSREGILSVFNMGQEPRASVVHELDTNQPLDETRILPYNNRSGCIVACGMWYFPAQIPESGSTRISRKFSEQLRNVEVMAACVFNDYSLVTVQRGRNVFADTKLVEYALPDGDGERDRLDEGTVHCRLRVVTKSPQVRVIPYGGNVLVLVCHLNGQIECVRFEAYPRALA